MIRKDDLIMVAKKDFSIEELAKQCEEAKKTFESLNEQLKKAREDEEDRKKAELALERDNRKKEVDEAFENYNKLVKAYIKDYGSYVTTTSSDDYNWFPNSFWRSFF